MLTGRVFHVPNAEIDSTSYHGGLRRYVRGDGVSYVGAAYGHGFAHDEIRDLADLTTLDSDTVRVDTSQRVGRHLRVLVSGGSSRQERRAQPARWQTTVTGSLMVLF
jgi:hypothetical protein